MESTSTLTDALLAALTVALFFCAAVWCLYRVVVWARRQSKRAYIIGAALAPFMALGMVVDPEMRIVQQAKQLKKREEDEPGDPPTSEDESIVRAATELAAKKDESAPRKDAGVTTHPKPTRPALVWVISVGLGLMASLTALVLLWILLADPAALAPRIRFARDSLSVFDWGSLLVMPTILLTSMILLFRLRKTSLHLFGAYLALGVLGSVWYVLTPERELYFDVRVTSFGAMPVAIAVLLYMLPLKKRAVLA